MYDICRSTAKGGCLSSWSTLLTTPAGATSFTVTGLTANTRYFWVVRARDVAANRDGNTVEVAGKTASPTGSVSALAAGDSHVCALVADGTVRCWGLNNYGQLGIGVTDNNAHPVPNAVPGLYNVKAITAGTLHTCALLGDGSVKCWGNNDQGRLGDNSTTTRPSAVPVSISNVIAIAAGVSHTCAMAATGQVYSWGANGFGQLGNGNQTEQHLPSLSVVGLASATGVAAGRAHSCAITTNGRVGCWGDNTSNQLGDGTTNSQPSGSNTLVHFGGTSLTGATTLSSLNDTTCAVTREPNNNAGIACWGDNSSMQIGNGSTTNVSVAAFLGVDGTAAASGYNHTCARASNGGVKCWGANNKGQVGDGTTTPRGSATPVSGLSGATTVVAGDQFSCALVAGSAKCWGVNNFGQLGIGTADTNAHSTPVAVAGLAGTIAPVGVAVGGAHACAVNSDGGVWCWGKNANGQLGDPSTTAYQAIRVGATGITSAMQIAAGGDHTCALLATGAAKCWGNNAFGELGDNGSEAQSATPVNVATASSLISIEAGETDSCAVLFNALPACWGADDFGQLADNTTASRDAQPTAIGGASGTIAVAPGLHHTCFAQNDFGGEVSCAGANDQGQLGHTGGGTLTPAQVTGTAGEWNGALASGSNFSCEGVRGGTAKCWGDDFYGQLGNGALATNQVPPGPVTGLTNVLSLAAGGNHACALRANGGARCWGSGFSGELGNGGIDNESTPIPVLGLSSIAAIAAGNSNTCALLTDGSVWCWGADGNGQIGDGTVGTFHTSPTRVAYVP